MKVITASPSQQTDLSEAIFGAARVLHTCWLSRRNDSTFHSYTLSACYAYNLDPGMAMVVQAVYRDIVRAQAER